ncbi:tape measure protein [Gordonia westfalica]|nr:tape measure protein [Gordonia westfalica]
MSTALGTALGIGVSKAAGAASKVLQDALSAGYNRITTLEKADIQFRNMGLSAGDTKRQLADLNDIVTGTSTSLADAAAAAAMLGGAGVAAGDDMNNAVKALVNISAASGASAQDIGLVMMQIKASGKLMGSEALQLAQRGVPIYDLIAKSIGKTTAEVRTLGEEGKISFDQVVTAINQGTGNLAKEMGETLPAKLANFRTAMGRLSAAGMEPFLLRAKGGVVGLTEAVNDLTPKMKDFALAADAKIFDQWVPQLKGLYATLEGSGALDRAAETFTALWDSLMELGPAARTIGAALAEASASLGVGGWQVFLATVQTASGILQGLAPVLQTVGDLMEAHPGYVTAALAAWLAFRTVPQSWARHDGARPDAYGNQSCRNGVRRCASGNRQLHRRLSDLAWLHPAGEPAALDGRRPYPRPWCQRGNGRFRRTQRTTWGGRWTVCGIGRPFEYRAHGWCRISDDGRAGSRRCDAEGEGSVAGGEGACGVPEADGCRFP